MNRPATASQSLGNPERKNTPCISILAGGGISFEKGKGVFLSGFCPPSIRAGGGTMRTKFWQNYFLGKGFAKTSAHLFLNLDVANGKGGVWGGIFHLLLFLFWRNSGRDFWRQILLIQKFEIQY